MELQNEAWILCVFRCSSSPQLLIPGGSAAPPWPRSPVGCTSPPAQIPPRGPHRLHIRSQSLQKPSDIHSILIFHHFAAVLRFVQQRHEMMVFSARGFVFVFLSPSKNILIRQSRAESAVNEAVSHTRVEVKQSFVPRASAAPTRYRGGFSPHVIGWIQPTRYRGRASPHVRGADPAHTL